MGTGFTHAFGCGGAALRGPPAGAAAWRDSCKAQNPSPHPNRSPPGQPSEKTSNKEQTSSRLPSNTFRWSWQQSPREVYVGRTTSGEVKTGGTRGVQRGYQWRAEFCHPTSLAPFATRSPHRGHGAARCPSGALWFFLTLRKNAKQNGQATRKKTNNKTDIPPHKHTPPPPPNKKTPPRPNQKISPEGIFSASGKPEHRPQARRGASKGGDPSPLAQLAEALAQRLVRLGHKHEGRLVLLAHNVLQTAHLLRGQHA